MDKCGCIVTKWNTQQGWVDWCYELHCMFPGTSCSIKARIAPVIDADIQNAYLAARGRV